MKLKCKSRSKYLTSNSLTSKIYHNKHKPYYNHKKTNKNATKNATINPTKIATINPTKIATINPTKIETKNATINPTKNATISGGEMTEEQMQKSLEFISNNIEKVRPFMPLPYKLLPFKTIINQVKNSPEYMEKITNIINDYLPQTGMDVPGMDVPVIPNTILPDTKLPVLAEKSLSELESKLESNSEVKLKTESKSESSQPQQTSLYVEDKPAQKDIIVLLKTIFRESWFQDQFLDILSRNLKTQYFNKILEVTLFNIFENILQNVNKNDNIIITISLFKNNINYFEKLFKQAIINGTNFADNERIFPSNDNVFRITSKISTQFSIHITSKFRELLLTNTDDKAAAPTDNTDFENIRGKYLLDLEKEKAAMDQEEKEYKAKKQKDRDEAYAKMISQNIQAKINVELTEEDVEKIMAFFNNMEGSIKDSADNTAIVITGERYNEMIIRSVCDGIKDMLEKEDSTKQIVRIVLSRFDYMLKEFIDIMQNNGILKMILLRIIDKYPFIFSAIQVGIENAINKKIEAVSKSKALGEAFITKSDIEGDYAFLKTVISSIIDNLTSNLELYIPSDENPSDTALVGGALPTPKPKPTQKKSDTRKKIEGYLKQKCNLSNTTKKNKKGGTCGWLW
jgi:hypothetical protein